LIIRLRDAAGESSGLAALFAGSTRRIANPPQLNKLPHKVFLFRR
jgi:hypothetical protein